MSPRKVFFIVVLFLVLGTLGLARLNPGFHGLQGLWVVVFFVGFVDMLQKKQTLRRNFPFIGHGRYLLEMFRPEINQYFIESNNDGRPFSREQRSVVYQRAKGVTDTKPFGTQKDLDKEGYEWINHSLKPCLPEEHVPRILIGSTQCQKHYHASLFNISAMSFGALSQNAILALNKGAKMGGFYHNTGEGGLSRYHLVHGGDIVWQLGTGYFGCRTPKGGFDPEKFAEKASLEQVMMIEVKLSQGAKPGLGGLLPGSKISPEIAEDRGIPMGEDCHSPPAHSSFSTPREMLVFLSELRRLSGGKPVGFKLCIGNKKEFYAICKAILVTGILPDFITVDGSEGGTGAAPLEFTNSVGMPLNEGLVFVHNALVGTGLRKKIHLIASGKIISGFDVISKIAMGADLCNSARGMMFAIGCIQALRCNTNHCPVGIATQNPDLVQGLDVKDKSVRVANYHHATIENAIKLMAAAGLHHSTELKPEHINRRITSTEYKSLDQVYSYLEEGAILRNDIPEDLKKTWEEVSPDSF